MGISVSLGKLAFMFFDCGPVLGIDSIVWTRVSGGWRGQRSVTSHTASRLRVEVLTQCNGGTGPCCCGSFQLSAQLALLKLFSVPVPPQSHNHEFTVFPYSRKTWYQELRVSPSRRGRKTKQTEDYRKHLPCFEGSKTNMGGNWKPVRQHLEWTLP